MFRLSTVLVASLLACSCGRETAPPVSDALAEALVSDFVFGVLGLNPTLATSAGYHEHAGSSLDEMLEDYSPTGLRLQRTFYEGMRERLNQIPREGLSAQSRADLSIVEDQVNLALLELNQIESHKHNPALYVETIGNALFQPLVLEYAPKPVRLQHIMARLSKIPKFLAVAKENLETAPEIWRLTAKQENEGNVSLIDQAIRAQVPPELRDRYNRLAELALLALRDFQQWLDRDLARRTSDWRLGPHFGAKLRYTLGTSLTPEQVLDEAQKMLTETRRQMLQLSSKILAGRTRGQDPSTTIRQALEIVARKHATVETYFSNARRDLNEARQFVQQKGLLALPPHDNLQVIETPEFMRGVYAVGGFAPAPALEPQLGAFYWLTPIPKNWPAERVESKLREYNDYGLKLLTIHEAMPGHYVQFEYANQVQPKSRRALRSIFGNGPYIEGWAVYATEMMLDEGYLDGSPELRLTFLKQQLRVIANAILDISLHTRQMQDEQAMQLMTKEAFQEQEEASAKLRRAKLSSTQLCTYFVGYREWSALRRSMQAKRGPQFRLAEFHESALRQGAVPMRILPSLME
ncbi:MAG: DUF885 domain-containing protein [Bryobacteraceae bacterium]|nr:DUF885 domain-containing protein [Bryobacteraceae bacterium]MDW8380435.1 DUF885 domain-containing protein [Bryobacterales bacterium]